MGPTLKVLKYFPRSGKIACKYRNGDVVMPYELAHSAPPFDVQAAEDADVVVITRNGPLDTIRPCTPTETVRRDRARVEEFGACRYCESRGADRHGNGDGLRPPETDWFHHANHKDRVFLATDFELFREFAAGTTPYKLKSGGHRPAVVHCIYTNVPGRFQNVEALVDLFLLARCGALSQRRILRIGARYIAGSITRPSAIRRGFIRL